MINFLFYLSNILTDKPTEVKLGIYVNSFYSISEQTMVSEVIWLAAIALCKQFETKNVWYLETYRKLLNFWNFKNCKIIWASSYKPQSSEYDDQEA